ncbi:MAG: AAA family ATPase [Spirochaetota bacterium]
MDLFTTSSDNSSQPLAYRMRPRNLEEYIGQSHIIGPGRLLRRSIQADQLSSVIFYGPPGTGKTTLARVIANTTRSHFATLNAVLTGVKQLREEIEAAKQRASYYDKKTILFIDEVHRWNKSQQDALLPWVENGTVILIGATTENPYFEVNAALVSRSRIFQLLPLSQEELFQIARQALSDAERGYGGYPVVFEEGALEHLVDIANGDARSLLNALELAVETTPETFPPPDNQEIYISKAAAEESIQRKVVLYDKEGDYHFDVISAFIKSIRGSDPDAALYWLARMVSAGEDPKYIFRRMLIAASEDIGLADPHALAHTEAAVSAFERVGMPEGRFHLAQATLYLATAPKSNSTMGFFSALKQINEDPHREVPTHLKDASRDGEGFGHGKGYQYPHAFENHWTAQQYLPDGLQGNSFYAPSDQGYERQIKEDVERRREAQSEAGHPESVPEILTFSPPDTQKDQWIQRLLTQRGQQFESVREKLFSHLSLNRHDRVLTIESGSGMLTWEACRRVPEGGVFVLLQNPQQRQNLTAYARQLPEAERPILLSSLNTELESSTTLQYEAALGYNMFTRLTEEERTATASELFGVLQPGAKVASCETIPNACQRLSSLCSSAEDRNTLEELESYIYDKNTSSMMTINPQNLESLLGSAGFVDISTQPETVYEQRRLVAKDIQRWIEASYLPLAASEEQKSNLTQIGKTLVSLYQDQIIDWKIARCFLFAQRP